MHHLSWCYYIKLIQVYSIFVYSNNYINVLIYSTFSSSFYTSYMIYDELISGLRSIDLHRILIYTEYWSTQIMNQIISDYTILLLLLMQWDFNTIQWVRQGKYSKNQNRTETKICPKQNRTIQTTYWCLINSVNGIV